MYNTYDTRLKNIFKSSNPVVRYVPHNLALGSEWPKRRIVLLSILVTEDRSHAPVYDTNIIESWAVRISFRLYGSQVAMKTETLFEGSCVDFLSISCRVHGPDLFTLVLNIYNLR